MATEINPLEKFNILSDHKRYRNSDEKQFKNYR